MPQDRAFERGIQQIEELIGKLDAAADAGLRDAAKELVQVIMDLHRAGLDRMMEIVSQAGDAGEHIIDRFGRDDLARSLLLLYGLHPVDLRTRVEQALEKVRPSLRSHGGHVEMLSVTEGVVHLRVHGGSNGCGSTALRSALEEAIYEAAPDLAKLVVEGAAQTQPAAFVPLVKLLGPNGALEKDSNRP